MKIKALAAGLLAFICISVTAARADSLTFQLYDVFSGATPGGTAPYLTVTITDTAVDTVEITFFASGLVGDEFVSKWYLNLEAVPSGIDFGLVDATDVSSLGIVFAPNNEKADGAGWFDLRFDFATSGDRFEAGDVVIVSATGTGLDASAFASLSTLTNGTQSTTKDAHYSAAHIQGIGENSSWVGDEDEEFPGPGIPEPSSYATGLGVIALAFVVLRRRANARAA